MVKQMIKSSEGEVTKKYLNTSIYADVTPASTGTLVSPTLPSQGIANGQREGDSLAIDQIDCRFTIYNAEASIGGSGTDLVRVVCVQARASNTITVSNASAPGTGVFDLSANGVIDVGSMINFNAKNKLFHVLYDKSFPVNFLSSTAAHSFETTLRPKIGKINFNPTSTTAQAGQITWIAISINTVAYLSLEQRLIYHDL
jgi:hypothetical protein